MNAIARMAVLDLRTVAPYRYQSLAVFALVAVLFVPRPTALLPVLVLACTAPATAYPFNVGDKANLETLYAVLPLPRRSVVYGHYAWAMALFLATASVGTALSLLFARVQAMPFAGHTLALVLTLSWLLFAVNTAIQFPLFIRFGYTRTSSLGTTLPLVVVVGVVAKSHLTVPSIQSWLPLLWVAGAAVMVASVAVAIAADSRRVSSPINRPARPTPPECPAGESASATWFGRPGRGSAGRA